MIEGRSRVIVSQRRRVVVLGQLQLVLSRALLFLLLLQERQLLLAGLVLLHVQLLIVDECLLQLLDQDVLSLQRLAELLILQPEQLSLLYNG